MKNQKKVGREVYNEAFGKKAKELFDSHTCNEFYFTSDGTAFSEVHHARLHAKSLKDKEITTIKREEKQNGTS